MRRALGLTGKTASHGPQQRPNEARARHKFVQDGGVPVVMLNARTDLESAGLKERIGSLEGALEHERGNHDHTKKQLSDALAQVQAVNTRLVHAELAHKDALAQLQDTLTRTQQALSEALANAPARRAPRALVQPEPEPGAEYREAPVEAAEPAVKRPRGRPRIHPEPEPKPVRWWTPSFKAARNS